MQDDAQAIRELITTWHRATAAGDVPAILKLMSEDVVFLQPGQPPMRGREAFAAGLRKALESMRIQSSGEVQELHVAGDWAYGSSRLTVTITPLAGGAPARRSGYTLSIFRRQPDGTWVLARDANMLTPES